MDNQGFKEASEVRPLLACPASFANGHAPEQVCDHSAETGSLEAAGRGVLQEALLFLFGRLQTVVCSLMMVAVFAVDLRCPRGIAVCVLYVIAVLLSLRDCRIRDTLFVSGICVLLVILGFALSPPGMPRGESLANRFLGIITIGIVGFLSLHREQLIRKRERALFEKSQALERLKVLRGCLPICAGCQRIRDGDGHWVVLETYIRAHSEAEFSHGLCHDCIRRLYPDIADQVIEGSGTERDGV